MTFPPRVLVKLATRLMRDDMCDAVVGDLVERFPDREREHGALRAKVWFASEIVRGILQFPRSPRLATSRGDGLVQGFLDDLRRGARLMRRAPMQAFLCTLTLGVGIGAATAIFSIADPMILRPLPYASPDKLFMVWETDGGMRSNTGFATFQDVLNRSTSVERIAVAGSWQPTLFGEGSPTQVTGLRVSWSYFRTLGVSPALGRDFAPEEDAQARNGVVVLSDALWRTRFGGDSALVGKTIDVAGRQMIVAGVMPAGYDDVLEPRARIWRVLGYDQTLSFACRSCRHLRMVARPKPGVTPAAMSQELSALSAQLQAEHPQDYARAGFQLVGMQEEVTRSIRPVINAVMVAVLLLLVIAAVNVGGIQLARALRRDGEFAMRAALGAGAGRLTRQLVAEGLVQAIAGGVVGVIVAKLSLASILHALPDTLPRLAAVHLDLRALAVAAALTLAGGFALGLLPAWHARTLSLMSSVRSARVAARPHRLRSVLVTSEVALAVALLAAAGLLTKSVREVLSVPPGFAESDVATAQLQVSGPRFANGTEILAWQDRVLDAARAVPGVTSVAVASQLPLGGNFDAFGIQAEDKPLDNPQLAPSADRYTVSADFFRTMRVPLIDGRAFESGDNRTGAAPVAVVSASLAQRIWHTTHVVGKRIQLGEPTRPWYSIVGVAGDMHHRGLDVAETMQVYIPTHTFFFTDNQVDLVVRTSGDPSRVLPALRSAVSATDPTVVVTRLSPMSEVVRASTAQRRLSLTLFGAFAVFALFLAGAGIFGALAASVAERRREIGLRSALGATPRGLAWMVLRQSILMTAIGGAAGIACAVASGRLIGGMLYNVRPGDPVTLAIVAAVLGAAMVIASVLPAVRAMRVHPAEVLAE
ncbi:MAG TPA: ABC transporter permease [Gemmatimonadaceae bacterium]|nr:ABC transporter permease [Gemmatimonadaceae bacterium]